MKTQRKTILCVWYISLTLFVHCSLAFSAGLSKLLQREIENNDEKAGKLWPDEERSLPSVSKRVCDGFPCMYSHLGSKAGQAALDRTLARFITDCFNDGSCNPGRRKRRESTRRLHSLMKFQDTILRRPLEGR